MGDKKRYRTEDGALVEEVVGPGEPGQTTFVVSRGTVVQIGATTIEIPPGLVPGDVTSPDELRRALALDLPTHQKLIDFGEWWAIWPFIDHRGTLLVTIWERGHHVGRAGHQPALYLWASDDFGKSWFLQTDMRTVIPTARKSDFPLITSNGTWLLNVLREDHTAVILRSTDRGDSWSTVYSTNVGYKDGYNPFCEDSYQYTVTLYNQLCRRSDGRIIVLKSTDDGATWTLIDTGYSYLGSDGVGTYLGSFDAHNYRIVITPRNVNNLIVSVNGGITWSEVTITNPMGALFNGFWNRWFITTTEIPMGEFGYEDRIYIVRPDALATMSPSILVEPPGFDWLRYLTFSANKIIGSLTGRPVSSIIVSDDYGFSWRTVYTTSVMGKARADVRAGPVSNIGVFGNYVFAGGGQIGTLWRILIPEGGEKVPAPVYLWANTPIAADDISEPLLFVPFGNKTIHVKAADAGTLTVETYDSYNDAWDALITESFIADTLKSIKIPDNFRTLRLTYDTATTITAWVIAG